MSTYQQILPNDTVVQSQQNAPASLCGRKLSYPSEIDEQLVKWVRTQQVQGGVISPDILRKEALKLIQPYCYEFKASTGWLDKFLTRHKLTLHPVQKTLSPASSSSNETSVLHNDSIQPGEQLPQPSSSHQHQLGNALISDNHEDDDDDDDDDENDKKDNLTIIPNRPVNPERLKAFNMFVRLFVDENLDRLVPISKQPKEKINAIIISCQRQFPEFSDRARKRIRTYLKSCRRSTKLREPSSRPSMSHIPATQLTEVNNILAKACQNESHEVAKRQRLDSNGTSFATAFYSSNSASSLQSNSTLPTPSLPPSEVFQSFVSSKLKQPAVKLSQSEVQSIRGLIAGYKQSAMFLQRSAEELERFLMQCEAYVDKSDEKVNEKENSNDTVLKSVSEMTNPPATTLSNPASKAAPSLTVSESVSKTVEVRTRLSIAPSVPSLIPRVSSRPSLSRTTSNNSLIVDSLLKTKVDALKEKLVINADIVHGAATSVISPTRINDNSDKKPLHVVPIQLEGKSSDSLKRSNSQQFMLPSSSVSIDKRSLDIQRGSSDIQRGSSDIQRGSSDIQRGIDSSKNPNPPQLLNSASLENASTSVSNKARLENASTSVSNKASLENASTSVSNKARLQECVEVDKNTDETKDITHETHFLKQSGMLQAKNDTTAPIKSDVDKTACQSYDPLAVKMNPRHVKLEACVENDDRNDKIQSRDNIFERGDRVYRDKDILVRQEKNDEESDLQQRQSQDFNFRRNQSHDLILQHEQQHEEKVKQEQLSHEKDQLQQSVEKENRQRQQQGQRGEQQREEQQREEQQREEQQREEQQRLEQQRQEQQRKDKQRQEQQRQEQQRQLQERDRQQQQLQEKDRQHHQQQQQQQRHDRSYNQQQQLQHQERDRQLQHQLQERSQQQEQQRQERDNQTKQHERDQLRHQREQSFQEMDVDGLHTHSMNHHAGLPEHATIYGADLQHQIQSNRMNHLSPQHITHEQIYRHNEKPTTPLSIEQMHNYPNHNSPTVHNSTALYQQQPNKHMHKHTALTSVPFNLPHMNEHLSPRDSINHTPPMHHGGHTNQGVHGGEQNSHTVDSVSENPTHSNPFSQQYYNAGRHAHLSPKMSMGQPSPSRGLYSATYHHQATGGSHHPSVFSFDGNVSQAVMDNTHQQYIHQRISPHASGYHGNLISPSTSPHIPDHLVRQSHIQELNRQHMLSEMVRQPTHSDYGNISHALPFDLHQAH